MNNALLHNNFNFNFSNQHSNPPAWKCGPFRKDSCNFLEFLVFSGFFLLASILPKIGSVAGSGALLGPRPVWLDFGGGEGPEEKRGETRRIEEGPPEKETGRGESRTNDTRKGETRRIEEDEEKRGETRRPRRP